MTGLQKIDITMIYKIEITEDAKIDLSFFKVHERKTILRSVKEKLSYEPLKETKNRKKLRNNPVAPWELRIGSYRVFYEVDNNSVKVIIISVGNKEHNILFIRGKRVKI